MSFALDLNLYLIVNFSQIKTNLETKSLHRFTSGQILRKIVIICISGIIWLRSHSERENDKQDYFRETVIVTDYNDTTVI